MAAKGGSLPILPGLAGLEKALTRRDPALVISALAQWELRRLWAHKVACAILEEDDRESALDEREIIWLVSLVSHQNHDEGTIRFCTIDLSWRRLLVERFLRQQDYPSARQALETYFTSPNAKLHDLMKHEPAAALEHVQTFGQLYEQHLARVEAAQEHTKRTGEKRKVSWPPKRFKRLVEPDEELLVKMTVDWAACEYRQLRKIDAICLKCRPFISGIIWPAVAPSAAEQAPAAAAPQAGPSGAHPQSQSNSQDSLPTPDPSSDGAEALAQGSRRRDKTTQEVKPAEEAKARLPTRKHDRSPSAEDLVVMEAPEPKRLKMDDVAIAPRPLVPAPKKPAAESSAVATAARPKPAAVQSSSPAPIRPRLRDSSVQTSPPPEARIKEPTPAPAPVPAAATKTSITSPRPRTRSPPPIRPAAPPLSTIERTLASTVLRPSKVDNGQIFSLLQRGAAEQQQRLERERRQSITEWLNPPAARAVGASSDAATEPTAVALPDVAAVPPEPAVDHTSATSKQKAVADDCEKGAENRTEITTPGRDKDPPVKEDQIKTVNEDQTADQLVKEDQTAGPAPKDLGPTSSAILMPPPATAASRGSRIKGGDKATEASTPEPTEDSVAQADAAPAEESAAAPIPAAEAADPATSGESSTATTSEDPDTQSSDSVVRDSQEQPSTQGSKSDISFPTAAQVHRERSTSVIYPQPGFTASAKTAATEETDISLEAPAAGQASAPTPDRVSKYGMQPSTAGSRFALEPSSVPSDYAAREFLTGSSIHSGSTQETSSSRSQSADFRIPAPASTAERRRARQLSEPPLEYPLDPNRPALARASSVPLEASQESRKPLSLVVGFRQVSSRPPATANATQDPSKPSHVVPPTQLASVDTDDLDMDLRMTAEEVEQEFAELEERQRASRAASSEVKPDRAIVAVESAALNNASSSAASRPDIGKVLSPQDLDLRLRAEAIQNAKQEMAAAKEEVAKYRLARAKWEEKRRQIAEEAASQGELVDDDEEEEDAVNFAMDLDDDQPFSQAFATQALAEDEEGAKGAASTRPQVSDDDGTVPARQNRSFANLEDEAELSEHEQDEVNKDMDEDMWGYLDILRTDP
ncbi:hypothetical protein JCM10908_001516 [Rhodotorula pacifica]|uniref:uncharacterized protein n=1 Tax=Rhodotorula pacifica TaxID=1495444 RepID=UPI0031783561